MFTATERIERDGVLIAFKGEAMTEAEAERRGILTAPKKPSKKPSKKAKGD